MKNNSSLLSFLLACLFRGGFGLFLLVCFCFTACSRREAGIRIGVSQCSDDEWRRQMNRELLREALFYDHVQIEIRTAKDDNRQQEQDIRHFIDEGVDLLVVAPNEAAPITPIVEEAYDHGIPVVVVDRKILSDKYTAYVGADNHEIGRSVGHYVVNALQGRGQVVEITGLSGSTPAMERHRGFTEVVSEAPGIQLLAVEDGAWLHSLAEEKMDSLLARFPHIDLVYAQNDRMADGAYDAALRRGREHEMRFVGTDALHGEGYGMESVLAGKLDASFIYPTSGDRVLQLAMDILGKRVYPRETLLNTSVVDGRSAPVMKMQTAHIDVLDKKIETLNGKLSQNLSQYATQQSLLFACLLVLLLVIGLLVAVYLALRTKNRLNRRLSAQKATLLQQKTQLEQHKSTLEAQTVKLQAQKTRLEAQTATLEEQKAQLEQQKSQLEERKDTLEQQKAQLEQLSRELEAATHAKLVFFTNISHDFRTPLTLIADPIDRLLADETLTDNSRSLLQLMKKNVRILLRLVNQILDFRKVENGRMELRLEPFDLLENFRAWNESFRMALLKRHITFSFNCTGDDFRLLADAEKMERIYFNLFSNAVKYTPENGTIRISLEAAEEQLRLTVFNSGSYISQHDAESIFERFYQVDSSRAGTGIGLALVRAFVEMHGGSIKAQSDEQGTAFVVCLPKQEIPADPPLAVPLEVPESEVSATLIDSELTSEEEVAEADSPTILVIDDNADIRNYVKSFLAADYRVLTAADGASGFRLALKYVPDVIVSDVRMPGMDGVECCRRLKSEMQTSHIPVILLTACSLDEQRIQGYDGGADSYISKPFSSQLLISRIHNLLDGRHRLKQFFGDQQVIGKADISELDKDFVFHFRKLVEERMCDSSLNVEDLGRDLGMSRVQLYRKLKSLTNFSPVELLRQMRLKKAASLLATSERTVAEIAYEVGFSSPSYFTKCYKEEYGESPTDFLKRKG